MASGSQEQLLTVLSGVIDQLSETKSKEAKAKDKRTWLGRRLANFKDQALSTKTTVEADDALELPEAPGKESSVEEQLTWVTKALQVQLQELNVRVTRDSAEKVEKRLREGFRKLSKKDKNTAHWMERTYTEVARTERIKLSQASFQRATQNRSRRQKRRGRSRSQPVHDQLLAQPSLADSMGPVVEEDSSHLGSGDVDRKRDHFFRTPTAEFFMSEPADGSEKKHSFDSQMSTVTSAAGEHSPSREWSQALSSQSARTVEFVTMLEELPEDLMDPDPACFEYIGDLDSWDFDMFRLSTLSNQQPLLAVCMKTFYDRGLFESLSIAPVVVARFFMTVESMYGQYPTPLYHNNDHAADVVQAIHCLLETPALEDCFSPLEVLAVLVAGAVHDVDHPGRTNDFLVKTEAPLAILYNDVSVLENHHVSTAFRIMRDPECNILAGFDKRDRLVLRKLIVEMVLGTDMVKHAKTLGEFRGLVSKIKGIGTFEQLSDYLSSNVEDRTLVLCQMVHSADLSATTRPWRICQQWTTRILEEFFDEGDEERRLGLELGALNDRSNVVVPKSQVGFISFITLPLWRAWSDLVSPDTDTQQLQNLKTNLMFWQSRVAGLEGAEPIVTATSPNGCLSAANGDARLTPVRVSITMYDSQDEASSAPQSETTSPMESPLPSLRQHRTESLQSLHKPKSQDAAAKPSNPRGRMQRTQSLDSAAQFNQASSRRRLPLASTMKTTEV